jgi:hypothetical protein
MKFIIRTILTALALIAIIHESKCDLKFRKYRLSRVFENLIEGISRDHGDEIENDVSRAYDMDCAKNFFKLPQNSKMMVHEFEVMIFFVATDMKCSDEDKAFEVYFNEFCRKSIELQLSCVQTYLQQIEPTSELIKDFKISEADREKCKKHIFANDFVEMQQDYERTFGPLNVYTCGAVSENGANDITKFYSKGVIIKYGNITDELKKSEKQKLKEYLKDVSTKTVNCIIKRFEDDPQGRFLIF